MGIPGKPQSIPSPWAVPTGFPLPCAGPMGRGNCVRTGRGLSPVHTLLRLVTGDGVGDWVGDVMGLFSWVLAWGRDSVRHPQCL